jgi:hypothetical protein
MTSDAAIDRAGLAGEELVKVTLVPVETFPGECPTCETEVTYGLMDAVAGYSDCNRAIGHIYRRDDEESVPHRDPADVITVYVPRSELAKFEKQFGEEFDS